ncbi:poly(3-hydroxyalkanoate) granule-associated protein PhaF [Pseudomonas cavernicola]|uniref:Poly(3-hydroxyalkanoate) granule-associated protein PhaF n=1 Tax=Pseudomonas cavernicola TaxID=2320866 RepID=A0A418XKY9_9PSED|nr:phasin family protein [Pseudomonas cavernicola]RJG13120.1 poly(3-hydroxyalkanoate) granule-associated protein PhaF [Pseudomonas cavernicola]
MVAKKKVEKENSSWIGEVEKYSRQIWLAGLGAYSKISKDGNKLFDTLVQDGEKAEKLAKSEVEKQVGAVKSSAKSARSKVDEVKGLALGKWGELEEAFDKRLNSAISRLGVPSRNEVKELHGKVETLTKQLEKLTGISAKSVKPAAKPAVKAAVKPAAKPAAKAAAKPAAKAVAKPAAKPAAKPVAKAAAKPAAKPAVKAAPKAAAKPAVKPAAKPAAKAAAKPAAAKPVAAKPAAPVATPATAPAAAPAATPAATTAVVTPSNPS